MKGNDLLDGCRTICTCSIPLIIFIVNIIIVTQQHIHITLCGWLVACGEFVRTCKDCELPTNALNSHHPYGWCVSYTWRRQNVSVNLYEIIHFEGRSFVSDSFIACFIANYFSLLLLLLHKVICFNLEMHLFSVNGIWVRETIYYHTSQFIYI